MEQVAARSADQAEAKRFAEAGVDASKDGPWTALFVEVPRTTLDRVARHELYVSVNIVDCRSGDTIGVTWATVGGVSIGEDFSGLTRFLKANPDQEHFVLTAYEAAAHRPGSCIQLVGGSYLLRKVRSERVPIHLVSASS